MISPIGELDWKGEQFVVNNAETGELSKRLYDNLTGIQTGTIEDPLGWIIEVN